MRKLRGWSEILVSWIYTRHNFGPRCPSFNEDCPLCQAWHNHDDLVEFVRRYD